LIHICKTIDEDVKYILPFIAGKIFYVVCFFTKDVDWFGYGKFKVFLSYKCLDFKF